MKAFIISTALLVLTGCTTTTQTKYVSVPAPTIQITEPSMPRPIQAKKFKIIVYDKEKMEQALADPNFRRVIGMSEQQYRTMIGNYDEAIRFIEAQAAVIDYYRNVIKELQDREIIKNESI